MREREGGKEKDGVSEREGEGEVSIHGCILHDRNDLYLSFQLLQGIATILRGKNKQWNAVMLLCSVYYST